MQVRHILQSKGRDVVAITTTATIAEAARLLTDRRIGALVVEDESGALTGIISERDLVQAIARAGLAPRVRVAHGDATQFDPAQLFGIDRFDRIFISYSLSMIPPWQGAIDKALAHLAPVGELRIIDFGRAARRPALSDWTRLEARDFRADVALERAFVEGYGGDPRESAPWFRAQVREAINTAVWAHRIGDDTFETQGHAMIDHVLRGT